jgi:hypothetical protein
MLIIAFHGVDRKIKKKNILRWIFPGYKEKKITYWSPISTHPCSNYTLYENKKNNFQQSQTKR